jgi:glycerophosphoryl diester phosphodiesterase
MRKTPWLLIAHRGASAVAPEGTRAALRAAVRAKAQMVELDVRMTNDGRLIIFHDDRLDRTTNGSGEVTRHRYQDLARLDAGAWFHPRFRGERILLASQAIRLLPRRMRVNLELKPTTRPTRLLRQLRRLARRTHSTRRLLVSSFDARLIAPLASSRVRSALICRQHPDRSLRQAIRLRCASWHPFHRLVTRARIARAHAAGLAVYAWTVNSPTRARQLLQAGIDGCFTNDPSRLRKGLR